MASTFTGTFQFFYLAFIFATECYLDAPCARQTPQEPRVYKSTSFHLNYTLCFVHNVDKPFTPCIFLKKKIISNWADPISQNKVSSGVLFNALTQVAQGAQSGSGDVENNITSPINITTIMIKGKVTIPKRSRWPVGNATAIRSMPWCHPDLAFPIVFSPCQSKIFPRKEIAKGFVLSPPLDFAIMNDKGDATGKENIWPYYQWILSNEAGASTSLSAFALLTGTFHEILNVSATLSNTSTHLDNVTTNRIIRNMTTSPVEVCVNPPFFFILAEFQNNTEWLDCTNVTCFLMQCWNGTKFLALVVHLPIFVPVPVEADPEKFPITSLIRQKRGFGITAAIVTAIVVSAASAVTAGTAMAHQVNTADTISQIAEKSSEALLTLQKVDSHIASGLMLVNQRVDILQHNMERMMDVIQMSCVASTSHVCITPNKYINNSFIKSTDLSNYLKGNWSQELERLQARLQMQILNLNGTRVEPVTLGDFTSWFTSAFSYFKEWVGVILFGAAICCGLAFMLWLVCKFRTQQKHDKVIITQALLAIENGSSPEIWLSMLKN